MCLQSREAHIESVHSRSILTTFNVTVLINPGMV